LNFQLFYDLAAVCKGESYFAGSHKVPVPFIPGEATKLIVTVTRIN